MVCSSTNNNKIVSRPSRASSCRSRLSNLWIQLEDSSTRDQHHLMLRTSLSLSKFPFSQVSTQLYMLHLDERWLTNSTPRTISILSSRIPRACSCNTPIYASAILIFGTLSNNTLPLCNSHTISTVLSSCTRRKLSNSTFRYSFLRRSAIR